MLLEGFSLVIPEGNETPEGYVEMVHDTQYTIQLTNNATCRMADVAIHIDGKHVGTWRLNPDSVIKIERPVNDTGKFTFYKYGTSESEKAGLKNNEMLGLITAIFKPEYFPAITLGDLWDDDSNCTGGTGLSGESRQKFNTVKALKYDSEGQVTINLRLVVTKDTGVRSLRPVSNPIPPPL